MKKYQVTGQPITMVSGRVQLNQQQFRARRYGLKQVGPDVYEIQKEVQFLIGEVIGCEETISFALLQHLTPLEPEKRFNPPSEAQIQHSVTALKEQLGMGFMALKSLLKKEFDVAVGKGDDLIPAEVFEAVLEKKKEAEGNEA